MDFKRYNNYSYETYLTGIIVYVKYTNVSELILINRAYSDTVRVIIILFVYI